MGGLMVSLVVGGTGRQCLNVGRTAVEGGVGRACSGGWLVTWEGAAAMVMMELVAGCDCCAPAKCSSVLLVVASSW
ncbi:hypothetical protein Dimus_030605, partial [Dionaea muscipula]